MRRRWTLGLIAIIGARALAALPVTQPNKTAIHGTITDHENRPINGAEVIVLDSKLSATTDSSGHYSLRGLPGGRIAIAARAIGFKLWHEPITVSAGSDRRLDVTLDRAAQALGEVTVMAAIPEALAAAYHRGMLRGSLLLTRKDIERRPIVRTFETLMGLPGIHVQWNPPGMGGTEVRFVRCPDPTRVAVWIDGQKAHEIGEARGSAAIGNRVAGKTAGNEQLRDPPSLELIEQLNAIDPTEIEAIEVFRGTSEIPAEYADQHSCAAVVIWSRTSWR